MFLVDKFSMLISIITINRNNLAGLKRTAESIYAQSNQDFEWVLVDGASSDGSSEYVKNIIRPNTIIISEPDTGIYNAMNKGTRLAHGDYCLYLNSGDCLYDSDTIAKLFTVIIGKNIDIFRGSIYYATSKQILHQVPSEQVKQATYWFTNICYHQASIIHRVLLLKHPYNETFKIIGDLHFFRTVYLLENVSDELLDICIATQEPGGVSSNLKLNQKERELSWRMLFGNAVYDDYVNLTSGKGLQGSLLQRMICDLKRSGKGWEKFGIIALALPILLQRIWVYVGKSLRQ